MFGSHAVISRWNPGLTLKVFSASFGSWGGNRGRSFEVTVGSAACEATPKNSNTQRAKEQASRFIQFGLGFSRSIQPFKLNQAIAMNQPRQTRGPADQKCLTLQPNVSDIYCLTRSIVP